MAEVEVYFNFNIEQGVGEFSEKDPDDADGLISVLATALRDDSRPPRTPENDSNLTLSGPKIGPARLLLQRRTALTAFSPDSRHAVYQDGVKILAVSTEKWQDEPVEIARFDHSPWQLEPNGRTVQDGGPRLKSTANELWLGREDGLPEFFNRELIDGRTFMWSVEALDEEDRRVGVGTENERPFAVAAS